jgi:dihydrofolate reductase
MVSIIVAIAENGVIGDKNALLWSIKEDMRHFRTTTTGHPVVMGRKTFESIGRPLPKRTNVVITRGDGEFEGCEVAHSIEEAVNMFPADEEVFIIGGAQIYAQALPMADKLYLTIVHRDYEGDTSFPKIDYSEWREVAREEFERGEEFDGSFTFIDFVRADR